MRELSLLCHHILVNCDHHRTPQAGRDFELMQVLIEQTVMQRLPNVRVEDLRQAWLALLARAKINSHHVVHREELSVREQMARILRQLRHGEFEIFSNLFHDRNNAQFSLAHLIVTFIAVLELAKESLVEITQSETLGNIYVRASRSNATTE